MIVNLILFSVEIRFYPYKPFRWHNYLVKIRFFLKDLKNGTRS